MGPGRDRVEQTPHRPRRKVRSRTHHRRRHAGSLRQLGYQSRHGRAHHLIRARPRRRSQRAGAQGPRARPRIHGTHGRHASRRCVYRPRLHRLLHQWPTGRPPRRRPHRLRLQGLHACQRHGRSRLASRQGASRIRRPRPRLPRGWIRLEGTRLLHVPGHESRHSCAGRALRLHQQPQL